MSSPFQETIRIMLQAIRHFWAAMTGRPHPVREAVPEAVLHDPAAQRPHDLDDPYFDPKIQKRFADVIANSVREKS